MNIKHIARVISEDIGVNRGLRSINPATPPEEVRELLDVPLSNHLSDLSTHYTADTEVASSGEYIRGRGPGDPMRSDPGIEVSAIGLINNDTGERMTQDSDYENVETVIEPADIIEQNPELLAGITSEELIEIMIGALPLPFNFGSSHAAEFAHDDVDLEVDTTWSADAEIIRIGEPGDSVNILYNIKNVEAD